MCRKKPTLFLKNFKCMKKVFYLIIVFLLGINFQNIYAQCTSGTLLSITDQNAAYIFGAGTTYLPSGNVSTNGALTFTNGGTLCIGPGATLNLNSNTFTLAAASNFTINVYGTLNFGTNPTLDGKWTINIYSGGTFGATGKNFQFKGSEVKIDNAGTFNIGKLEMTGTTATGSINNTGSMTITDDFNFAGNTFSLNNNSTTPFSLKTLAISNSAAVVTVVNNTVMNVSSTLNLNNGKANFKNLGTLTVGQNYNSSPTSTYVNCGTYNGSFNLNGGGKLINSGTFTSGSIEFGGSASRVENYGRFTMTAGINMSGSVFYNEGIMKFTSGYFQGTGTLQGPSGSTKKGYFSWTGQASLNSPTIGPNLNFSGSATAMFNGSQIITGTVLFNQPESSVTLSQSVDCPNADGTPSTPVPTQTSACYGVDLTSLQPSYSNVVYEWWTGSTSARTAQITSPSVTNYTATGTVYLWAKNVSSGVYSSAGTAVTVNALPPTPSVSTTTPGNVCPAITVNLTSIITNASGYTVYYKTTNSSSGPDVPDPTKAVAGVYYIFFKNSSNCYNNTGVSVTATVSNCPPAGTNDLGNVNEDATLTVAKIGGVLSNDTDPNSDALTISAIRTGTEASGTGTSGTVAMPLTGTYGTLTLAADGSYTYVANLAATQSLSAGATATDYFTYTVSDGKGGTDLAQLSITITGVNDAPTVAAITKAGTEDTSISFTATDFTSKFTDVDGSLTKIKITSLPADGTLYLNSTAITLNQEINYTDFANIKFTPAANWNGSTSFNWNGSDGTTYAASSAAVNITISPVNDAPATINDVNTTFVGMMVNGNVLTNDSDPEGNTLTVNTTPSINPSHGSVTLNANGTYIYTPVAGYTGEDSFSYQVCDNGTPSACATASVTIDVIPTPTSGNDAPVAVNDNYQGALNKTVTGNVLSNDLDPDGNTLTVASVKVDLDGDGQADDTMSNFNTTTPTTVYGINAAGSIVVAGTLILNSAGAFTFIPATGFTGTVACTYVNSDGSLSDDATVSIKILNGVTATTNSVYAIADAASTPVNTAVSGNVLSNDYDPENNSMSVNSPGTYTTTRGGSLTIAANGSYTFTPKVGDTGDDTYNYTVCDNGTPQACSSASLTIAVYPAPTGVNDAPVAVSDAFKGNAGSSLTGNVKTNDVDPDGDVLTLSSALVATGSDGVANDPLTLGSSTTVYGTNAGGTKAVAGNLTLNSDGTFSFVPLTGFVGTVDYNYTISDGHGGTDNASVKLYITGANTTVAVDDSYYGNAGTNITGNVKANDYDPMGYSQTITAQTNAPTAHGKITLLTDGSFIYTPNAGYFGTDQFIYTICNSATPQACNKATVYLNVAKTTKSCLISNKMITTEIK